jgi:hypothetical protein
MGSGGIMYIPSFIKFGSGIERLLEGDTHADTDRDSKVISYTNIYFLKKKIRLKLCLQTSLKSFLCLI